MVDKVQFWELTQSQYDNLETKDSYTFYKTTSDNVYLGEAPLTSSGITSMNKTLTASGWTGSEAPYAQTLTVDGLTASQDGILSLAQGLNLTQITTAANAVLSLDSQADGRLTILALGEKPEIDIPVTILLF